MAKIITHVLEKKELIKTKAEADKNQVLAQAAILGGIQSVAWREYMKQFCDKDENGVADPTQLMRLTGEDNSKDKDRNRAYLVANGMCGDFTRAHFEENVQTIDEGLAGQNC